MTRYALAPNARRELYSILDYLSDRSPSGARRVNEAIHEAIVKLAERPAMGHLRQDLTRRPLRFWNVLGRYTIIYRGDEPPIEVIHIVGPGRDIKALLR